MRSLDIWACGITLFNMLTGDYPFEGNNIMSLQANILTEEANLEKIKDPRIKEVLELCLKNDYRQRIDI